VRLGQRSGETEHGVFMPMLRTTPTALEMLPENDPEHPEPEPTTDPSPPR
jgi:hypothetical protein